MQLETGGKQFLYLRHKSIILVISGITLLYFVKFVLGVQRNIIKESKEISRQHKSIKETEALQALGLKETKVVDATNMKISWNRHNAK